MRKDDDGIRKGRDEKGKGKKEEKRRTKDND